MNVAAELSGIYPQDTLRHPITAAVRKWQGKSDADALKGVVTTPSLASRLKVVSSIIL